MRLLDHAASPFDRLMVGIIEFATDEFRVPSRNAIRPSSACLAPLLVGTGAVDHGLPAAGRGRGLADVCADPQRAGAGLRGSGAIPAHALPEPRGRPRGRPL